MEESPVVISTFKVLTDWWRRIAHWYGSKMNKLFPYKAK